MVDFSHILSAEELLAAVDESQAGFAIYDRDLNLIFANTTIRNFLPQLYEKLDSGLSMQACMEFQVLETFPDLSANQREQRVSYIIETIKSSGAMDVTTPDGRKLSSVYKKTSSGKYMIVTMDVTERMHQKDILKQARQKAESASAAKSDFLSSMSHELRTPLSGIYSAAQILHSRIKDGKFTDLQDFTEIVLESASHLNAIINDVLSLSKIESGKIELHPKEDDLQSLLNSIAKAQRPIASAKGIDLHLIIERHIPNTLVFDRVRLRQCITNLMSNAVKFTKTGSVTLAAKYDSMTSTLTLHVADTGIGMSPEEQANVFSKFQQANVDICENYGGTGLGLTITQKLAHLMQGDVSLVSEHGKGSIFTLTLTAPQPSFHIDVHDSAA